MKLPPSFCPNDNTETKQKSLLAWNFPRDDTRILTIAVMCYSTVIMEMLCDNNIMRLFSCCIISKLCCDTVTGSGDIMAGSGAVVAGPGVVMASPGVFIQIVIPGIVKWSDCVVLV